MVSNKNRNTKYKTIDLTEEAVTEFLSCWNKGIETQSETMLRIVKTYKSKCPGCANQGSNIVAEQVH